MPSLSHSCVINASRRVRIGAAAATDAAIAAAAAEAAIAAADKAERMAPHQAPQVFQLLPIVAEAAACCSQETHAQRIGPCLPGLPEVPCNADEAPAPQECTSDTSRGLTLLM